MTFPGEDIMTELKLAWFLEAIFKRWGLYYGRGLYYCGRVRNAYFWPRGRARLQKMAGKETQDSLLLLESKEEGELSEALKRNLLLEPDSSTVKDKVDTLPKQVIPEPGFCVKTKTETNKKVFINICKSEQVPSPKDISDDQLQSIVQSGDATHYRVPLSLGEPHVEKDNSNHDCTVYDVIIGSSFYETVQSRPVMKDFLLTIVLEGLEEKYNLRLCRECKIMKNRKFLGNLPEQNVRKNPKPFIIEMNEGDPSSQEGTKSDSAESTAPEPEYTLIREPDDGDVPEYLIMEVKLPKVTTSKAIALDIGVDRLELTVRPNLYHLHIDLPFTIESNETVAQFNKDSKILFVTLPVNGIVVDNVL